MSNYAYAQESSKELLSLCYTNTSVDEMESHVHNWFVGRGYSLKTGSEGRGAYVKGNRVLRILLGAFYKYFLFEVWVEKFSEEETRVEVKRSTTGMSGGVIGMRQVTKEMEAIDQALKLL